MEKTADVESGTNSELFHISRWMIANSLTVNPKKTLALLISPQLRNDCSSPLVTLTLNSEMINTTETARYLGIIIDSKLKFQSHISLLEKRIARSVGILTKLSHFLPQEALLNLYYSLIHSQLLYALSVWCATYKTYLIKVKRLQKKAIRAVTKTKYTESITPHYKKLQILKLDDLFIFEITKLMYLFIHNKMPDRFKHYFTYSTDVFSYSTRNYKTNQSLYLTHYSTNRTQRSFKYLGVKIWNSIPQNIKQHSTYRNFRNSYKYYLISDYK